MLYLDFSQIIIGDATGYFESTHEEIDLNLLRHISLSSIIKYKRLFNHTNENTYICLDGTNYWRKQVFPNYKKNRKESHKKSRFDWNSFYKQFNQIKEEFRNELPYKMIEIPEAEADDIISTLCKVNCSKEDIIIVSSDKDFAQIKINICDSVKQYSPFKNEFIDTTHKKYDLFEHIIKGDSSDGIPNIFSDDDTYINSNKRCKPIRSTTIDMWRKHGMMSPELFCPSEDVLNKYNRNKKLIDLREIPQDIECKIIDVFNSLNTGLTNFKIKSRNVLQYFIKHNLRKLIEGGEI